MLQYEPVWTFEHSVRPGAGKSEQAQREYEKAAELTNQLLSIYSRQPPGASGLAGGANASLTMTRLGLLWGSQGKYAETEGEFTKILDYVATNQKVACSSHAGRTTFKKATPAFSIAALVLYSREWTYGF